MRRKSQYSLKNPWWLFPSNTSLHYFIYYVIRSYWIIKIPIPHEIQIYILVISFVYFSYHFTNVRTKLCMYFLHFLPLLKASKHLSANIKAPFRYPVDTDVFKTFSGFLKKFYDQTGCRHGAWQKMSDLRRLENVWFRKSWRSLILRCLEDVWFTTSWRRL